MVDVDQFYYGTTTTMRLQGTQREERRCKPGKRRIDVLEEDLKNMEAEDRREVVQGSEIEWRVAIFVAINLRKMLRSDEKEITIIITITEV